jgi:hypothetical protein
MLSNGFRAAVGAFAWAVPTLEVDALGSVGEMEETGGVGHRLT